MLDANPALTVQQVRDILRQTAIDFGPEGQDVDYGWGRLDAYAAVKAAAGGSGSGPAVPGHLVFRGTIPTAGGRAEHTFTVADTTHPINVTMIMPNWTGSSSPDFDLYVFNPDGTELGRATGTSRQEQVGKRATQIGTYKVEVRGYSGTGDYILDVSAGTGAGAPPDNPPTVAFDQPADGGTVAGTVTVIARAADDSRVSKVEVKVDEGAYAEMTAGGGTYSWTWNTAATPNGEHSLTARATDSAGQTGTATRRVTVANEQAPPPPPPEGAQTITRTGRVTSAARDAEVTFAVNAAGYVDLSLTWPTRSDLDFFVYAPDGTYIGRAYTTGKPETFRVDTVQYGTGTYRVRVNLFSGADSDFTLTAAGFKEESYTGTVTSGQRDVFHERAMAYTGRSRFTLSWGNRSDLDFFLYDPSGRERGRAYTLNNPEVLEAGVDSTGTWKVRVNLFSGTGGEYTLKMTVPDAVLS